MLTAGTRLGPYEVVSSLGAGGMGEVYRARDTRLGRDVAIRILPGDVVSDPERLRRFEQEARAAAALNHPNILALYDIGHHSDGPYIVSELLDGDTLRERLNGGALPVRKTIEYAVQIAHGLAAAHEKGIVHRDLKPENVFLTTDGRVKILDFGLAKLTQRAPALAGVSDLPTTPPNTPDTTPGMLLGTIGYMSPEQVRGLEADHRSDIFALGTILYELLTGQRAFRGTTTIDTMTAILKEDPPDLPSGLHVPPALTRIVDRSLAKNPAARFQSAGDLAFALEALSSHSDSHASGVVVSARGKPRMWVVATLAGVGLLSAAVIGTFLYSTAAPDAGAYRASILPPEGTTFANTTSADLLALSPDGRRIAFNARGADGKIGLWVQRLDQVVATRLPGPETLRQPFWSPDGRYIGFISEGRLKRIDTLGGLPITIAPAPAGLEGTWGPGDVILFTAAGPKGGPRVIWRVSASGGAVTPATKLDAGAGDNRHVAPYFLPDGRHFLYFVAGSKVGGINDPRAVYVGSLDPGEPPKLILEGGSNARYASGHLFFLRGQTLMAQPFDLSRLALTGQPSVIAEGIATASQTSAAGAFSVSNTGVLAYQTGAGLVSQLAWLDRAGKQLALVGDDATYETVELSPDGKRLAVTIRESAAVPTRDIWVYDLARGLRSRLTFDRANEANATWSPDGAFVAFDSDKDGDGDLYRRASNGTGSDELILKNQGNSRAFSWSSDGRFLLYQNRVGGVWALPMFGDRKPLHIQASGNTEPRPRFSPDGRWISYASDESGRGEVYVTPWPNANGKWQVSTAGGHSPRWRRDGREIYYIEGNRLMAVPVNGSATSFDVGRPQPLFQSTFVNSAGSQYDVSADGQRFLVSTAPQRDAAPITLVVNWPALLRTTNPATGAQPAQ